MTDNAAETTESNVAIATAPQDPEQPKKFSHFELTNALDRGTFSDLKLVCGDGVEFDVHKVILCTHSSFFYSACTIDMKEKAENLIKLPEVSPVIKSILEFCYSGTYVEDSDEVSGRKALHNAKLYVAAEKYDIRGMEATVNYQMMEHVHDCERELQAHSRITRRAAITEDTDCKRAANNALNEAAIAQQQKNWDGLLATVKFLLENCHHEDSIRSFLACIDWSSIVIDEYQADWIMFLASHPSFAAEVISTQGSEEWQLNHIMDGAQDEIAAFEAGVIWHDELGVDTCKVDWASAGPWFAGRLQRLSAE